MHSLQNFATGALVEVIRRQPPSHARTTLGWQLAVGPVLARVTSVEMDGTTLRVRSVDPRWLKEIDRAAATVLPRLQQILGKDQIVRIVTR